MNTELAARGLPKVHIQSSSRSALLVTYVFPQATAASVTVLIAPTSSSSVSLSLIVGICIGGFVFVVILSVAIFFVGRNLRKQAMYRAFLLAFRNAKSGEPASQDFIPRKLRKIYTAEQVLGKGAFGCVVRAKTIKGGQLVALKLIVPEKGSFDDREMRQLSRESNVLELFTASDCEHAVHLAGVQAVNIQNEIAWFVMELLVGDNMQTVVHDDQRGPISDLEGIKAARNILAALKVFQTARVVPDLYFLEEASCVFDMTGAERVAGDAC
jgi:hypothetical protein